MSHTPREQWDCLNCRTTGELDQHGRCQTCGSDSVLSVNGRNLAAKETGELERIYKLEQYKEQP